MEENEPTVSLLDVVRKDYQQQAHNRSSRICLVGLVNSVEAANNLAHFHEDMVDRFSLLQPNNSENIEQAPSAITGVLFLINNTAFISLIEASTDTILTIISLIYSQTSSSTAPPNAPLSGLTSLKILTFLEETPREFHLFLTRSLRVGSSDEWPSPSPATEFNVTVPPLPPPHIPSPLLPFAFPLYWRLLGLSALLKSVANGSNNEDMSLNEWVDSSIGMSACTERAPSVELISGLCKCEELMSAEELLDVCGYGERGNAEGIEMGAERERVWPAEKNLMLS